MGLGQPTFDLHTVDRGYGGKVLLEVFDAMGNARFLKVGGDVGEFDGIASEFGRLIGSSVDVDVLV